MTDNAIELRCATAFLRKLPARPLLLRQLLRRAAVELRRLRAVPPLWMVAPPRSALVFPVRVGVCVCQCSFSVLTAQRVRLLGASRSSAASPPEKRISSAAQAPRIRREPCLAQHRRPKHRWRRLQPASAALHGLRSRGRVIEHVVVDHDLLLDCDTLERHPGNVAQLAMSRWWCGLRAAAVAVARQSPQAMWQCGGSARTWRR